MFLGLSWTGEGHARKRRDERRRYIDFAAVSASRAACAASRRFLNAAFRASTHETSALGALALGCASQIVTPPVGDALAATYVLVGNMPFRPSTSTRRPWPSAPDGTTHSLSSWSAMR